MPKYPIKKLEQFIVNMQSGFACGKQNEVAEGIVHLRTHNISLDGHINLDKLVHIPESFVDQKKYNLKKNDIVFNNTNSAELVGKTILIEEDLPYAFSNHLTRLRFTDEVLPEWILFVFQMYWQDKVFEKMCTRWIGQAGINQGALEKIEIPVPTLSIQKEIVAHLSAKIGALHQAQSLRESTLADTEKILLTRLCEIFQKGKEEGWEEKNIENICEHPQYGFTASSTIQQVGPQMLRITDIQDGAVNWSRVPYCKCDDFAKYQLKKGDIVFARTGATVGKSFLIDEVPENTIFASYLIRLRTQEDVLSEFLYYFFQSSNYWNQITEQAVGGAQPNVNGTKLANLKIYLPSLSLQKGIIAELVILSDKIRALKQLQTEQIADMKRLENAYLREAFTQ